MLLSVNCGSIIKSVEALIKIGSNGFSKCSPLGVERVERLLTTNERGTTEGSGV